MEIENGIMDNETQSWRKMQRPEHLKGSEIRTPREVTITDGELDAITVINYWTQNLKW